MPGPAAPRKYVRDAAAAASRAARQLTPAARRCLDAAQAQSRQLDDNHVGTEHMVLGVLAADREVADVLAGAGITAGLFRAQLLDEPGPSPRGPIPLTPRAKMILGLAQPAAGGDSGTISPRHLMLAVIAESRDWRGRGLDGPHHLEKAATAAGTSLALIESALLRQ
ncbi:MAG TPA: Clp protease N-terminal domain-containing protein [Streptosporangiaceae bacterium]|nr:Clp protease N-terminal domain-containing protein [Streptosporangiaceae bacterium]